MMIEFRGRVILFVTGVALFLLPGGLFGADLQETLNRFNQSHEITAVLFAAAYSEHGKNVRISAVLAACDKPGIADLIKVTPETVRNEASKAFPSVCKGKKYCDEEEKWLVLNSIQSMWTGYVLGYQDAAKGLISGSRDPLCAPIMDRAIDILGEKSKDDEKKK